MLKLILHLIVAARTHAQTSTNWLTHVERMLLNGLRGMLISRTNY